VPRQQEQQLVGLLQLLEQQTGHSSTNAGATPQALAGVADVQLSLTSLEEVFLNIAKQARGSTLSSAGPAQRLRLPGAKGFGVVLQHAVQSCGSFQVHVVNSQNQGQCILCLLWGCWPSSGCVCTSC
jgi:hypothetical protein